MDREIVEKFATCTVQPGELRADDHIVEMAQALLKAEDKLAEIAKWAEIMEIESEFIELIAILEKD